MKIAIVVLLALLSEISSAQNTTVNIGVARVVFDSSAPGTFLGQDYLAPASAALERQLSYGYNAHSMEVRKLGGTPLGPNMNVIGYWNISTFSLGPTSDPNLLRNINDTFTKLFIDQANGYFPVVLTPATSDALAVVLSEFCERHKVCFLVHPFSASKRNFVCSDPLPADCIARGKRIGQRRFEYSASALFDSSNNIVGFLNVIRNKGYRKYAIIYSNSEFGTGVAVQTISIASSMKLALLYSRTYDALTAPSVANQTEWIQTIQALGVEAVLVVGSSSESGMCGNFMRAMREVNWTPKAAVLGGGCLTALGTAAYPDLYERETIKYFFGAIPWDINVRGQEYRAYHSPGSGIVEPWGATDEEDSPQVFARKLTSYYPAVTARSAFIAPVIAATAVNIVQKSLEAVSASLPLNDLSRPVSVEDIRAGSLRIWTSSVYGRLSLDVWGRTLAREELIIQYKSNTDFELITPIASGAESVLPIPTWDERVYQPSAYTTNEETAVLVVTAICMFIIFMMIIFTIIYRETSVIKASTVLFCIASMVGSLMLFAGVYTWPLYETTALCNAKVYLLNVGFTLMFASIFIKTFRLWWIFYQGEKSLRVVRLKTPQLMMYLAGVVAFELLFTVAWTQSVPITAVTITQDKDRPGLSYEQCHSDNYNWLWASFAIKGLMITLGIIVTWITRHLRSDFNESNYIAVTIYNAFFMLLVGVPIVIAQVGTREFVYYVRSFGIDLLALSTPLVLMLPKFYVVLKYGGRNPEGDSGDTDTHANGSGLGRNSGRNTVQLTNTTHRNTIQLNTPQEPSLERVPSATAKTNNYLVSDDVSVEVRSLRQRLADMERELARYRNPAGNNSGRNSSPKTPLSVQPHLPINAPPPPRTSTPTPAEARIT